MNPENQQKPHQAGRFGGWLREALPVDFERGLDAPIERAENVPLSLVDALLYDCQCWQRVWRRLPKVPISRFGLG